MTKALTGNKELDAKKAKITRPSNRNIDSNKILPALAMNGEVEELYEVFSNKINVGDDNHTKIKPEAVSFSDAVCLN